jgi:hypothetical protein
MVPPSRVALSMTVRLGSHTRWAGNDARAAQKAGHCGSAFCPHLSPVPTGYPEGRPAFYQFGGIS